MDLQTCYTSYVYLHDELAGTLQVYEYVGKYLHYLL